MPAVERAGATHGTTTTVEVTPPRCCFLLDDCNISPSPMFMLCFFIPVTATSCQQLISRICYFGSPLLCLLSSDIYLSHHPDARPSLQRCRHASSSLQVHVERPQAPTSHSGTLRLGCSQTTGSRRCYCGFCSSPGSRCTHTREQTQLGSLAIEEQC
jgi:hypothetical protein